MASKAAQKRLTKEYAGMQKEPPPFIWAVPDEKNILNWNYIIRGPPDSPFTGGEYHGVLMFPSEYPFKPPGIKMLTPSGRFSPDKKICFSMSDFHPGTWNPAWSVATILTALLSFMVSDEITTGSVTSSDSHKRVFAARSHEWNLKQTRFREAFPDYCTPSSRDLPNMGQQTGGNSKTTDPTLLLPPSGQVPLLAPNASVAASQPQLTRKTEETLDANGAAGAWTQVVWAKWRWVLLIALAVVVSRLTSSRV
ncbi:UBC-like protein [Dendrothele bispora CBS 962.96]|uniref:Ubiquitin-conjugating enzyme E2 6 n=1 Tax=Dendrothele bispora (strain CBS 962.96) TaxID=1314807 RepID=A0A4S8LK60_DENBC|nr:UBC-like protein [Dendrothele bispora CBS 962.96]